jgi:hypothetical protein
MTFEKVKILRIVTHAYPNRFSWFCLNHDFRESKYSSYRNMPTHIVSRGTVTHDFRESTNSFYRDMPNHIVSRGTV